MVVKGLSVSKVEICPLFSLFPRIVQENFNAPGKTGRAGTRLTDGNAGKILATMPDAPQQRFRKSRRRGILVSALVVAALVALTWFWLAAVVPYREHFTLYFSSGAHGLSVGAPVMMNGRTIGQVSEIALARKEDAGTREFFAAVTITVDTKKLIEYGRVREDRKFRDALPQLTELGLRGQLRLPSMLASGLCVNLLFEPDKPSRLAAIPGAKYPEIPTNYKSTSDFVDQANAFIETKNLYALAEKIRALGETAGRFRAAADSVDCGRLNTEALFLLERADAALSPSKVHETLASLNAELVACRRELERGNALTPERAESLKNALKNLSENLREMKSGLKGVRENLSPEGLEARRALIRELRERCVPLIDFAKDALF